MKWMKYIEMYYICRIFYYFYCNCLFIIIFLDRDFIVYDFLVMDSLFLLEFYFLEMFLRNWVSEVVFGDCDRGVILG